MAYGQTGTGEDRTAVYSDPEVMREKWSVPALLCILLSEQEPIAQFLWQSSAATTLVADTKHTVYQSQRRIFLMTVNLQHWLLRGKLSAQVVTGETILLNLQCTNVLRQTERKCGWWYNLTFTRALKSCSWKEQVSHIETLKWSWPLLSENISNKKFYNRGVIFFRSCFCFFVFLFLNLRGNLRSYYLIQPYVCRCGLRKINIPWCWKGAWLSCTKRMIIFWKSCRKDPHCHVKGWNLCPCCWKTL